jgi:hypothetical protein
MWGETRIIHIKFSDALWFKIFIDLNEISSGSLQPSAGKLQLLTVVTMRYYNAGLQLHIQTWSDTEEWQFRLLYDEYL